MTEQVKIVSKVLVHEVHDKHMAELKDFLVHHNLIGLKAANQRNIVETLKSNIDLGAVFLCEDADSNGKSGLDLAGEIHVMRPELPIFLRRATNTLEDLPTHLRKVFAAAYQPGHPERLMQLVEKYLFNTYYPSGFIRGIEELSQSALQATFRGMQLTCSTPYLIRDRIIYGEMFSMMPLEGNWCRGYMMLQTEEKLMRRLIESGKTALEPEDVDFRSVNSLMGEVTNMIWGGFKARFFSSDPEKSVMQHRVHVPIIINHDRKYITFGVEDPQLCFQYTLRDKEEKLEPMFLYQKFVFHLGWAPEEFKESPNAVNDLVQAGELELF